MAGALAIASAAGCDDRDWAGLPEQLLLMFVQELEIPDLVRSGAVCSSWHTVYLAVRRHRFPLPISRKQLPCLLYACRDSAADDDAVVCCPFTGDSVRAPLPQPPLTRHSTVGSAHGWLVTADEASNLHLLNPITGAQAALPPITTLHHVESCADAEGRLMYNVFESGDPEPIPFQAREARDCMYHRVTLSCSPSAGSACVVLLVHMPFGELSYARLGDERWTWISTDDHQGISWGFMDAFYSEDQGLFYALCSHRSVFTLDFNGPSSLVVKKIMRRDRKGYDPSSMYILQAPWGDILQVWRWRSYAESSMPVELPRDLMGDNEDDIDRYIELRTTEIEVYKVDLENQSLVKMTSLADHALFLGYNSTMCFATKDFPALKPNCVYITDDSYEYVNMAKHNWREIGVWDIENKSMQTFDSDLLTNSWMNWPSPVWITPSLF